MAERKKHEKILTTYSVLGKEGRKASYERSGNKAAQDCKMVWQHTYFRCHSRV
jgi:hypothetical protein